jgi:hypothetical protein
MMEKDYVVYGEKVPVSGSSLGAYTTRWRVVLPENIGNIPSNAIDVHNVSAMTAEDAIQEATEMDRERLKKMFEPEKPEKFWTWEHANPANIIKTMFGRD